MPLLNLPSELLLHILGSVEKEADLNSLIQANQRLYTLGKPYLYRQNAIHHNSIALGWGAHNNKVNTILSALEHGANVNNRFGGPMKPRPLHAAADGGATDAIKLLLQHDADVNARTVFGETALLFACRSGHLEAVKVLLEHPSIDPNTLDEMSLIDTPLCCAVALGHLKIVERLLACERVDVNRHRADGGNSALYHSVTMRDREMGLRMTALLLAHPNINPNFIVNLGWTTPLMEAAGAGDREQVRLLLEHPRLDIGLRDSYGKPALTYAARSGNVGVVQLLLKHGADLNERYRDGSSALVDAARSAPASMVSFLLSRGADPSIGRPLIAAVHMDERSVQLLLADSRTDVNARDLDGWTALFHAVRYGRVDAVETLLWHPLIDVGIKDGTGATAEELAQQREQHDIVALFRLLRAAKTTPCDVGNGSVDGTGRAPHLSLKA